MSIRSISIFLALILQMVLVHAHDATWYDSLTHVSWTGMLLGALCIVVLIIIALKLKTTNLQKKFIFLGIVLVVVLNTVFLIGSTIYVNNISESHGPVHWHADFEVYMCDEKIDLKDPSGISNRIGTSVLHEHGDDRIHVEGVVLDHDHVSLAHSFEVIGGELSNDKLRLPTNDGLAENPVDCNGIPSSIQIFIYQNSLEQKKVDPSYVLSPYPLVPPGDCIIIEFGPKKETTEHLCESYRIAKEKGEL